MLSFYHVWTKTQVCTILYHTILLDTVPNSKEFSMELNNHCPVEATLELIGGKYKALIL